MPRVHPAIRVAVALTTALALAMPPLTAPPAAVAAACTITRGLALVADRRPARGVFVLLPSDGRSVMTDEGGRWSFDVGEQTRVLVRIVATSRLYDVQDPTILIPEGTVEVTYRLGGGCRAVIEDVRQVVRAESAAPRLAPPPLPPAFRPSIATRTTPPPQPVSGNGGNVPWVGYFWLTAPTIQVGVCSLSDATTRAAAETALERWAEAADRGLVWRLIRNDTACIEGFPQPHILIGRERLNDDPSVLAITGAVDIEGAACTVRAPANACWVMKAVVVVNPAGFDSLSSDQQVATVLHEVGHALGLGHTRGCGDSVMWFDTGCNSAPTLAPGLDDIASLNELFTVTQRTLLP